VSSNLPLSRELTRAMKRLLAPLLITAASASAAQTVQIQLPPNWAKPHVYQTTQSAFRDGGFIVPIRPNQMGIIFEMPATVGDPPVPVRSTSAEISNAAGVVIRNLWSNRAYPAGRFGEVWDGNDDYGKPATGGPFTVLLQYNGVQYTWDGILGDTSPDLFAPNTWGGVTLVLPGDMVTLGETGIAALGYDEGTSNSATFSMKHPMVDVRPFVPQNIGRDIFTRVATDGKLVYFADHTTAKGVGAGVVAFDKKGYLHNFSGGEFFPGPPRDHFHNEIDKINPRFLVAQACDVVDYPAVAITGVAVQRKGNILATAHGSMSTAPSANAVFLWDKTTCAPLGSFAIANPQRMVFDLNGNLWVISGTGFDTADVLSEVTEVGKRNLVTTPISGLDNPMALAISPVTGDLFIADGGKHQQVLEYDLARNSIVRTLGDAGGYGTGRSCNASVTHYKFWFDYGGRDPYTQLDTISVDPFVYADDNGGLEVEDPTTGQIEFYSLMRGRWQYTGRVLFEGFQRSVAVAINNPSRIFLGKGSLLEINRDWSKPLLPGDPDPVAGGNGSWALANNWWPCIQSADGYYPGRNAPRNTFVWTSPANGNTYLLSGDKLGNLAWNLLHSDSSVTTEQEKNLSWPRVDPSGNYVRPDYKSPNMKFYSFTFNGYDAQNMPTWATTPGLVATIHVLHVNGDPVPHTRLGITPAPTTAGVYVVYDTDVNRDVPGSTPAFHLGGFTAGASAFIWRAMPQKDMAWPNGNGDFPSADLSHLASEGGTVTAVGNEIFTMYAGNGSPTSACQFTHYHTGGLFVGQFGYMQKFSATPSGENSWGVDGVPYPLQGENKVPGFCGDVGDFQAFSVGSHIKLIHPDESTFHGLHEWDISGLDTITELSATGVLGATLTLHSSPQKPRDP
jgi:hypothetical protein